MARPTRLGQLIGLYGYRTRPFGPTSVSPPRRPPEGALGDAVLRWGRACNFRISAVPNLTTIVNWPTQPEDEEADPGLIFTETERQTTTVRVENPDDSEQFVDVERIDQITFLGPDGIARTFVLTN